MIIKKFILFTQYNWFYHISTSKIFENSSFENIFDQKLWLTLTNTSKIAMCQRMKTSKHRSYDEMQSFSMFTRSWKKIMMNFIMKLLFNRYDNDIYDVILIIIYHLFKMTLYVHVKFTWTTKNLIDIFLIAFFWRISK